MLDMLRITSIERFRDPEAWTNYISWNENWHRATGQVVEWMHNAPTEGLGPASFEEMRDVVREAQLWRPMNGAVNAVSSRKFTVRQDKKNFTLSMTSVPDLEFLDLLLERRASPKLPEPPFPRSVNSWFAARAGSGKLEELDDKTWDSLLKYAWKMINWQRSGLPEGHIDDDLPLTGNITLRRGLELYAILFGLRIAADSYVRVFQDINPALLSFTRDRILQFLADADPGVQELEASDFVELMTYRSGQSAHASAAPFIPFQDRLILAPALVSAAGVERTLLRSVASNPDRFGSLGQQLGRLADRLATIIGNEVPGVSVMTRVKAVRENRSTAGDIDVLAVDPRQRKVFAIEVKWPVEALTLKEAAKVESDTRRGAVQLDSLRTSLERGEARLPERVEDITAGMDWSWFVATPGQLAETGVEHIYPTSIRHIISVLPVRNLDELEKKLRRRPKIGEHFLIGQDSYQRLGLNVVFDTLESLIDESDFSTF